MLNTQATQTIKATLAAFGPNEAISMTQDTWVKLHEAMSVLIDQSEQQEPVAWIEHEWSGTGLKHLHFERRDPMLRDEVVNPVWTPLYTSPPAAPEQESDHEFKNFHRSLCERFGYVHDEKDWKRDLVSLEEWIAKKVQPQQEPVAWAWRAFNPDEGHYGEWETWKIADYAPPRQPSKWFQVVPLPSSSSPAQRKPLTDEQINAGRREWLYSPAGSPTAFEAGVRFAEAAHGIKENT